MSSHCGSDNDLDGAIRDQFEMRARVERAQRAELDLRAAIDLALLIEGFSATSVGRAVLHGNEGVEGLGDAVRKRVKGAAERYVEIRKGLEPNDEIRALTEAER